MDPSGEGYCAAGPGGFLITEERGALLCGMAVSHSINDPISQKYTKSLLAETS